MSTQTRSLSGDFGGVINADNLKAEINANVVITTNCLGINIDGDVVDIVFAGVPSGPEITELDTVVIPGHDNTTDPDHVKGEITTALGPALEFKLLPGTDGHHLVADSAEPSGLKYEDPNHYTSSDFTTDLNAVKGQNNGVAELNGSGKVPQGQLPAIALTTVHVVADIPARDALSPVEEGDVAKVQSESKSYIYDGAAWCELEAGDHYTSSDFNTDFSGKSTTDLSEGTNQYFTNARADDRIANANLEDLNNVAAGAAAGDLLLYNGTTWSKLAKGAADTVLTVSGPSPFVSWQAAAGGYSPEALEVYNDSGTRLFEATTQNQWYEFTPDDFDTSGTSVGSDLARRTTGNGGIQWNGGSTETFQVNVWVSMGVQTGGQRHAISISKNGGTPATSSIFTYTPEQNAEEYLWSTGDLVSLSNGDYVTVCVRNESAGGKDITIHHATMRLVKVS